MKCLRALVLLYLVAVASGLRAQTNYVMLRGVVEDPQHLAIPRAEIKLTAVKTGAVRHVTTNAAGVYEVGGLLPGAYLLEVQSKGFALARRSFQLEVGQQTMLDVTLTVGPDSQTVTAVAAAELLKTADASLGEVVDQRAVAQLPLNGRMLVDLMLSVPGAHMSHGAQTGDMNPLYWRPGQRSAISVGGNRPNANYFLLDGATNTDPTFNTQNFSASPDAVQEFQVQIGSYSAEMGGAGGGQVNIVTRSGGTRLHGTAYEFLRNGALDAHSFNEMGGTNHLVQNNFGGSLGGPVIGPGLRKGTFFFLNYEALRHVQADSMTDTVPTPDEVAGDFSKSRVTIYDPKTQVANANYNPSRPVSQSNPQFTRQAFPGNKIPVDRMNPVAVTMLTKYTPQPNVMVGMGMGGGMTMMGQPTVVGSGNDSNNYLDVRNEVHYTDQGTVRIDHQFGQKDTAFARYSAGGEHGFVPENLPGFGYLHDNLSQQGMGSYSHVFTPSLLNVASVAVSRLSMNHTTESANKSDITGSLGIAGVGFGGPGAWGAPYFSVQGYSPMGDSFSATPMHSWDTIVEGRDTLSWQVGRHGLKFGGAYQRFIWPMWGFFQNRGYYQFTNGFTTDIGANDGTGSALASFLLGLPVVRQRQAGIPQMNLRQWSANGYAQDTFRLTRKTTLDYGVRYEYMSALVDIKYTNSNLTFGPDGTPSVFIGGQNGFPKGLMYPNRTDFAPRVGISQSVPGVGLVLHAAYGIFYTPVDMNTWCNQRHNVPYTFPETNQSDNFTPSIKTFDFASAVLGTTVVSFTGMQTRPAPQYIQQWSASLEQSLGKETVLEIGYLGSGGFHLQRSHLINNAQPGPGLIQPRRPFRKISFVPNTTLPPNVTATSTTFGVSTINLLENSAQSWYDAGYVNVRRRAANGLSFLANYTWSKSLSNAPDFRSPMFEAAIPQDNSNLQAEKGPACDVRNRLAISAVYDVPKWGRSRLTRAVTADWLASTVFQAQSGFPLTISVFGDTANAGTALGENPIRANVTGKQVFGAGTRNAATWFNPAAFAAPRAYTFGNAGRNSVVGPGMEMLDLSLVRGFPVGERVRLETRGEFFNALNHTNLGTPNRFVNTAGFGSVTEVTTPGREVQVSARLSF
ncbi:MAG: carboxypeptidase regulatory-like domain-containing protein [Acidobacteriota bacterium]|nr:carboxypeptidase regulatory-like domain-containing protein [Acidobacteriota bacterium]